MQLPVINTDKVKHLTINTVYKEYRNKTLIILMIGTIFLLYAIHTLLSYFHSDFEGGKNYLDILNTGNLKLNAFYLIISSWNGLLSLSLGLSAVKSDQSSNVLQQILAFPISKADYLISRIAGTWFLVMGYYLLSMLAATLLFVISGDQFTTLIPLVKSLFVTCLVPIPLIMLSILASFFLSKIWAFASSMIFTLFVSYAGQVYSGLTFKEATGEIKGVMDFLSYVSYILFPRVGVMGKISQEFFQEKTLTMNPYTEIIHFGLTTTILFFVLKYIFKKRG